MSRVKHRIRDFSSIIEAIRAAMSSAPIEKINRVTWVTNNGGSPGTWIAPSVFRKGDNIVSRSCIGEKEVSNFSDALLANMEPFVGQGLPPGHFVVSISD